VWHDNYLGVVECGTLCDRELWEAEIFPPFRIVENGPLFQLRDGKNHVLEKVKISGIEYVSNLIYIGSYTDTVCIVNVPVF